MGLTSGDVRGEHIVEKFTKRIKQQIRSKRGKEVTRKIPGQGKEEWLRPQVAGALQERAKAPHKGLLEATSDTPAPRRRGDGGKQAATGGARKDLRLGRQRSKIKRKRSGKRGGNKAQKAKNYVS